MPAAVLKIGGTARQLRAGSLSLVENINGRSTLRATVRSLDGSYIPDVDDVVQLEDSIGTRLFKGLLTEPDQAWATPQGLAALTTVTAEDHTALASRRLVKGATSGGVVARDIVDILVSSYLSSYGVTRDPSMGAGATIGALTYDYAPVSQVMNDLVAMAAPAGWVWRIDEDKVLTAFAPGAGTYPCPFSVTTGSSHVAGDIKITRSRKNYFNKVTLVYGDGTSTPAEVYANDLTEQSTYGIYETVIRAQGPLDSATAQDLVDAYLAKILVRPRTIVFSTLTSGARAGQTLTVNLAARSLNADFLITSVETRDIADGNNLLFTITAVEGGITTTDWKDTFRSWSGGSSGQVAASSFTLVTSVVGRSSYFLGGSGIAGEQSAGPSVLNAVGYIDVMLDSTALPPGTSVTAVVQCRTADVSAGVTPQVYNVTTAAVAGTGTLVTGTSWTTVTFTITLASGQNLYRLRMTPDTAGIDCYTLGYLEVGR